MFPIIIAQNRLKHDVISNTSNTLTVASSEPDPIASPLGKNLCKRDDKSKIELSGIFQKNEKPITVINNTTFTLAGKLV